MRRGLVVMIVGGAIVSPGLIYGLMIGLPAYSRTQSRLDAQNQVMLSSIEIQNQAQRIKIEQQKAEVRVAEAKGIAQSQAIIASSLTDAYLQYLAIQAQEKMAQGTNHTEVYIPSGQNGIPLVRTVNPLDK